MALADFLRSLASPFLRSTRAPPGAPTAAPSNPPNPQASDLKDAARATAQKIRTAWLAGRFHLLPWLDPYTDETDEIRQHYTVMLREPVLQAAVLGQVSSVASQDAQVHADDPDDPRQAAAAKAALHALKKVHGGSDLVPIGSGTRHIAWSVLSGAVIKGWSLSEVTLRKYPERHGPAKGKIIWETFKAKDTDTVQPVTDRYWGITGIKALRYNPGVVFEGRDLHSFVVFNRFSLYESPLGISAFRSAYRAFWIKDTAWKLRALHLDRFTHPYFTGTYTSIEQKAALEEALEEMRGAGWATLPVGGLISAIDIAGRGTADFESAIRDCNEEMLTGVCGAYLHMMTGQAGQERGDSQVQQETTELFQWALSAALGDTVTSQMLAPWYAFNYHDMEPGVATWGAVSEQALQARANLDKTLQEIGYELSAKEGYAYFGRQRPINKADVLGGDKGGGGGGGTPPPGGPGGAPPPSPDQPSGGGDQGSEDGGQDGDAWTPFGEEPGFTGEITDSLGRKRHYQDGKQVAGPHDTGAASTGKRSAREDPHAYAAHAAARLDATLNGLHRQLAAGEVEDGEAEQQANDAAEQAHDATRRAAATAFGKARDEVLSKHGDTGLVRSLLAGQQERVRDTLNDLHEALQARANQVVDRAERSDRDDARSDVQGALERLKRDVASVGAYVERNLQPAERNQSIQEAGRLGAKLAKKTAAGKPPSASDREKLASMQTADRFATLSQDGDRWRVDTPLVKAEGGYYAVSPDGTMQLTDAQTHEPTTPGKLKEKRGGQPSSFGEHPSDWHAPWEDLSSFAESDWVAWTLKSGPRKGQSVYKNTKTGKLSDTMPGGKKAASGEKAAARSSKVKAKDAFLPKPAKLTVDAAHAHVKALIDHPPADLSAAVKDVVARLSTGLKGDELAALAKKLGLTGGGSTKEQKAQKLLDKALAGPKPKVEKKPPAKPSVQKKPPAGLDLADLGANPVDQVMAAYDSAPRGASVADRRQAALSVLARLSPAQQREVEDELGIETGDRGGSWDDRLASEWLRRRERAGPDTEPTPTAPPAPGPAAAPSPRAAPAAQAPKADRDALLDMVDNLGDRSGAASLATIGRRLGWKPERLHAAANALRAEGVLTGAAVEGRGGVDPADRKYHIPEPGGAPAVGYVSRRR